MASNKHNNLPAPPPPMFFNAKERNLVKQVNQELEERIIGQNILYFPIDLNSTNYHPLYGEAIEKTFLPAIYIYALVDWEGRTVTTDKYGIDRVTKLTVRFHKRRLVEDQNVYVREGDFIKYGDIFYEIVNTGEPRQMFGQVDNKVEIVAECIQSRDGLFNSD